MTKQTEYKLLINGKEIASCFEKDLIMPVNVDNTWSDLIKETEHFELELKEKNVSLQYYYHRHNRYFFRNPICKLVVTIDKDMEFPGHIKRGEVYNMIFE